MAKSTTTPKLEDSPVFQERMKGSLGGAPTTPAQFQPVARGPLGEVAADAPQPSGGIAAKAKPKTIFDEDPDQAQYKAWLDQIRSRMNGLVSAISSKTEALDQSLLNADDNKEFMAYCKKHGFDAGKAAGFLMNIHDALDGISA